MATVDLVMPKLGESIMEATILKWHKQPGEDIKMDETLLEIATDKVDSEVPSTAAGVVEELLFKVNDVVPIGAVIARIRTSVDSTQSTVNNPQPSVGSRESGDRSQESGVGSRESGARNEQEEKITAFETVSSRPSTFNSQPSTNGNRFYSPLVLNIAASEGVSMTELEKIPGTGNEGRVTKKDILQYVSDKKSGKASSYQPRATGQSDLIIQRESEPQAQSSQLVTYSGNVEII